MCAGDGIRWGNYGGRQKWLTSIDGETLIVRMARLAREHGETDIHTSVRASDYASVPADLNPFVPAPTELTFDSLVKFENCFPLWDADEILYLHGDTYYTEEAMQRILEPNPSLFLMYGRNGTSLTTGKHYGEVWAFRIKRGAYDVVHSFFSPIEERYRGGKAHWSAGRELFLRYYLLPLDVFPKLPRHPSFIEMDDLTEDFDSSEDLITWLRVKEARS
jgi:hypothetical protein